ncbi:MarR family transcriptional regulator [Microbacterium sp. HD4P20]|uniref:MarR family winged helix-turn-helix transcriptional regulator n=1 Tax=Microbacterium sp. HD4P20 TaxID=2864874 RepID=UPI001C63F9DE|nr:MarR family transcriptional regulator [Microbacterium sp. HD4P20]MCP2635346.1 MarR family transcriptional regulator [Microbacterium sp. HD4P20]
MLLMSAASIVTTTALSELAAQGHPAIRVTHVPVFMHIDPAGTAISTLAERSGVSRQAMSMTVRDLESHGYVVTAPSDTDRRAILVSLTERGARLCEDAARISSELAARWSDELGDDALPQLRHHLRTIVTRSKERDTD